jgi:hypothetical protein
MTGANGKLRATSVKDAKKLNLFPSYSTIVQAVLAKPGLDVWKQTQLLDACSETPYDMFDDAGWRKKVIHKSATKSRKASDRGTEIHDKLEQAILQGIDSFKDDIDRPFIEPVYNFVINKMKGKLDVEIIPEASFVHPLGYGGKVDLHSPTDDGWVLDFKTKDFTEDNIDKVAVFTEHTMQLAAYREGLKIPRAKCYNLFISISTPGLFKLIEHDEIAVKQHFEMFCCLLKFWQLNKQFKPMWS